MKMSGTKPGAVLAILKNPAHTGTCVYGRISQDPTRRKPGRPHPGLIRCSIDKWPIVRHNAYPAYISGEEFLANQAQQGRMASEMVVEQFKIFKKYRFWPEL